MARIHLSGLHIRPDGTVGIRSDDDLERLLRCPVHDLSGEIIVLEDSHWLDRDTDARNSVAAFLNSARERIINEGRLPAPLVELPGVGSSSGIGGDEPEARTRVRLRRGHRHRPHVAFE